MSCVDLTISFESQASESVRFGEGCRRSITKSIGGRGESRAVDVPVPQPLQEERVGSRLEALATVALASSAIIVSIGFVVRSGGAPVTREERLSLLKVSDKDWNEAISIADEVSGSSQSDVSIIVFTDLQCPACKSFHDDVVSVLVERYPSEVRIMYLPFPLPYHAEALTAAKATECIGATVDRQSWYDLMYAKQDSLGKKSYLAYAQELSAIDSVGFERCISSGDTSLRIKQSMALGHRLAVPGTPSVAINRVLFSLPPKLRDVDSVLTASARRDDRGEANPTQR